jgi:hypothetical protein
MRNGCILLVDVSNDANANRGETKMETLASKLEKLNVRTINENIVLSGRESTDGFMVFYGYDHAKKRSRKYTIWQQADNVAYAGMWFLKVGYKIFEPEEEYMYSTYTEAYNHIKNAAIKN